MYKKCSLNVWQCNQGTKWWHGSANGLTVKANFVWNFHDWIRNIPFTRINRLYTISEDTLMISSVL